MDQNVHSKTDESSNKPEWVKALEEAALVLKDAVQQSTPEMTDSKTRVAYGWIDMSRLYKEVNPVTAG